MSTSEGIANEQQPGLSTALSIDEVKKARKRLNLQLGGGFGAIALGTVIAITWPEFAGKYAAAVVAAGGFLAISKAAQGHIALSEKIENDRAEKKVGPTKEKP